MRTPTTFDAVARWLAASLAGGVLLAIVPSGSLRWPAAPLGPLDVVHLTGVGILIAAWLVFVGHVVTARESWAHDGFAVALVCSAALAVIGCIVAAALAAWQAVGVAITAAVAAQVLLALRIERRREKPATRGAAPAV